MRYSSSERPDSASRRRSVHLHREWVCTLLLLMVMAAPGARAQGPERAAFPLEQGEAVVTCFSGFSTPGAVYSTFQPPDLADRPVVAVVDVRAPEANGAVPGRHWYAPMYHNEQGGGFTNPTGDPEDAWTSGNLGQVFGIALDGASPPNIYVAAASIYALPLQGTSFPDLLFGPLGPGGVYRLDGATGAICKYARLPNTGPGLGNLAYDPEHDQFLVSNFEDGLLYRVPRLDACPESPYVPDPADAFDHGLFGLPEVGRAPIPDDGLGLDPSDPGYTQLTCDPVSQTGFTQLGRRTWGLQTYAGRLYYAVWNEDGVRGSEELANEIWSVGLLADGGFDTEDVRREVEISSYLVVGPLVGSSHPVADIAFSGDGSMLVAERGRCGDSGHPGRAAHAVRVMEYTYDDALLGWIEGRVAVGWHLVHNNAAGGVDYGFGYPATEVVGAIDDLPAVPDALYWATGDALRLSAPDPPPFAINGLQGTPRGPYQGDTNQLFQSFFIDLNADPSMPDTGFSFADKNQIGDVEIVRTRSSDPCLADFTPQILCQVPASGQPDGTYSWRFRITHPGDGPIANVVLEDLPAGVTAEPERLAVDPPLAPGIGWVSPPVVLDGAFEGEVLDFRVTLQDEDLAESCSQPVTLELPDCGECARLVTDRAPSCSVASGSSPFSGAAFSYRYQLQLTNLLPSPVERLLAHAVEPGDRITPIPPERLRVTSPGALASPVDPDATTRPHTLVIEGPDARPGREVCVRLSTHDAAFRESCSLAHCFTLPYCLVVFAEEGE